MKRHLGYGLLTAAFVWGFLWFHTLPPVPYDWPPAAAAAVGVPISTFPTITSMPPNGRYLVIVSTGIGSTGWGNKTIQHSDLFAPYITSVDWSSALTTWPSGQYITSAALGLRNYINTYDGAPLQGQITSLSGRIGTINGRLSTLESHSHIGTYLSTTAMGGIATSGHLHADVYLATGAMSGIATNGHAHAGMATSGSTWGTSSLVGWPWGFGTGGGSFDPMSMTTFKSANGEVGSLTVTTSLTAPGFVSNAPDNTHNWSGYNSGPIGSYTGVTTTGVWTDGLGGPLRYSGSAWQAVYGGWGTHAHSGTHITTGVVGTTFIQGWKNWIDTYDGAPLQNQITSNSAYVTTLRANSQATGWITTGTISTARLPANSSTSAGIVASGAGQDSKVWKTDAAGDPQWRDDVSVNPAQTYTWTTTQRFGSLTTGARMTFTIPVSSSWADGNWSGPAMLGNVDTNVGTAVVLYRKATGLWSPYSPAINTNELPCGMSLNAIDTTTPGIVLLDGAIARRSILALGTSATTYFAAGTTNLGVVAPTAPTTTGHAIVTVLIRLAEDLFQLAFGRAWGQK